MAFCAVSGTGLQLIASQILSLRPSAARSTASVKGFSRTTAAAASALRVYNEVFKSLEPEVLTEIWKDCRFGSTRQLRRSRTLTCTINNTLSLMVHPSTSQIYIQRRGFRSRTSVKGVSGRKNATEETSLLARFLPLRKEGFVKGVLSMKSGNSSTTEPKKPSLLRQILSAAFTIVILISLFGPLRFSIRDRQLGSLIFSNAQEVKPEEINVTFEDVRGMDEAKKEVEEIVSYLRDPERYSRLGGRLPKGVLLVGPPGTGKTLLARAIAGEAQVPFFHTSGSEFDEVLVGQGARRVRDLFERAKRRAPCIVFIDEIDSVGSKRVSNSMHPYANQTINQLLAEMDGFNQNEGVIIIGATNRVEDLDKALLRAGRFDMRVMVNPPDLLGRKDIFRHYLSKIIHTDEVDVDTLAKGTTGFTGADIENMVNQAALRAAIDDFPMVMLPHFEEARDRILMGPARLRGRLPDEESNRITAYHEAGHTLVGLFTKDAVPLHKVTIIPRGQSLGHTAILPEKDEYHMTKAQMMAQLDVMMGGRVAEELVFGTDKVTTGAANDLKKATILATNMVKTFGMSEKVGLRDYTTNEDNAFVKVNELSPQTSEVIDQEINRLLNDSYTRAKEILLKHKKEHKLLADALLEYETLSSNEVKELLESGTVTRISVPKTIPVVEKRPQPRQPPPSHIIHLHFDQPGDSRSS